MDDLKALYRIMIAPVRGSSHEARLESFYAGQAEAYDSFRKRLLHGRQELFDSLPMREADVWVDFGAGTGTSLEFMGTPAQQAGAIYLVDLSPSLLKQAEVRIKHLGLERAQAIHGDVTQYEIPDGGQADLITFSYSLTMIPDWFAALDRAWAMLKPGGTIGVVDFYVARKYPTDGRSQHGFLTRNFWPTWFGADNVFLSSDHLPYLNTRFDSVAIHESTGSLPYVPFLQVPYYLFIGRKRLD